MAPTRFFTELANVSGSLDELRALARRWFEEGLLEQLFPGFNLLDGCTQEPSWHGEGDGLVHTELVFAHAAQDGSILGEWRALLLVAALVHDIEKPATRKVGTDGSISFNMHAEKAAKRCAEFARTLELSPEMAMVLEWLVKHHMEAHLLLTIRPFGRLEFYDNTYFYLLAALQAADALASWRNADGTEHAEDHREEFKKDATDLRLARDLKAATIALKKRVTLVLQSRQVKPAALIGQAGNAAWEWAKQQYPAIPSEPELEAWLDQWLDSQPE